MADTALGQALSGVPPSYQASDEPEPRGGGAALSLAGRPDLETLLNAVDVALYVTDAEGRLTFYNDAAARLWGWCPPLHATRWAGGFRLYQLDGTPLAPDQTALAIALREGRTVRGLEAILERPDGSRVPFIPYPTLLHDGEGKLVGAVNALVDVSERKAAEARAQQASLAKTRFLAAMSHEFRTPIHAILGFSGLLADAAHQGGQFKPEHAEWIGEMQGAARHLLDLITDVIGFAEAKISEARPVSTRRPVRLGAIVSDALSVAATAFAARGLAVLPEGDSADTIAAIDAPAARQALLGVLKEVARHMPAGGEVRLAWGGDAESATAWIVVRCPGLALPPDLLAELDRPFASAERDIYARGLEGAGLSVAISAALLRGHGGQLVISAGSGDAAASFRLTFPMATDGALASGEGHHATPTLASPTRSAALPRPAFALGDVIAAARDVIVVTSADLDPPGPTIVYVNPAFTSLTGYTAEEAIGRTPRMLQGPGTDREVLRRISEDLRAGREARATVLNYGRDGAPYWLEMHIVPLRDSRGEIRHFAAIERVVETLGDRTSAGAADAFVRHLTKV